MRVFKVISLGFFLSLFIILPAYSLNVATHSHIDEAILLNGNYFDNYLRNNLGFENGIRQPFNNKELGITDNSNKVLDWIKLGGKYEDLPPGSLPYIRSFNHFHDPISNTGYTGVLGFVNPYRSPEYSIIWAQDPNQYLGKYSWQDARNYFYNALTASDDNADDVRQQNFADCFRAIGQQMHLLQDASVPAHVRNDAHFVFMYEGWVEWKTGDDSNFDADYLFNPSYAFDPSPSLLQQASKFASAKVPIANLFDTQTYDGSNPDDTTGTAVGLTEYTNANFLSENTAFKTYPYPKFSSVTTVNLHIPDPQNAAQVVTRPYYVKTRDGDTSHYLVATRGYLSDYVHEQFDWLGYEVQNLFENPALDEMVYQDYSHILLPRAVGYSKALLQYFFRGDIDAEDAKATIDTESGNINGITMTVKNNTPGEPIGEGTANKFVVSYSYKSGDNTVYGVSGEQPYDTDPDHQYNFAFTDSSKFIPPNADKQYMLVYRGKLGMEDDAVAGKSFKPSEPIIIDDWEAGQIWTAQDPRSTLCLDSDAPYQKVNALKINVDSSKYQAIITNLFAYHYITGYLPYYIAPGFTNPSPYMRNVTYKAVGERNFTGGNGYLLGDVYANISYNQHGGDGYAGGAPFTFTSHIEIYEDTGSLPGSLIATSNPFIFNYPTDVNNFLIYNGCITSYVFPGPVILRAGVTYNIFAVFDGQTGTVDDIYFPIHNKNSIPSLVYKDSTGVWGQEDGQDPYFQIYVQRSDALAQATIPKGCTGKNTLKFAVKSHIAGNPMEFKYGIDNYGEFTSLPAEVAINQADTWEVKTIDISQLTDAQKAGLKYWSINWGTDAFDSTTGESRQNTIYIDELTAE